MATLRLKNIYWDPKTCHQLQESISQYVKTEFTGTAPEGIERFIEENLQKDFASDSFSLKEDTLKMEIAFDQPYIGYILWLMDRKFKHKNEEEKQYYRKIKNLYE